MRYYLLQHKAITALPIPPKKLPESAILLKTPGELDARRFPIARLLGAYNMLPGIEPVQRFKDRKAAVSRFWAALEALPLGQAGRDSKQRRIANLVSRPSGASMKELIAATGWQPHSIRGVIAGTLRKRLKLKIEVGMVGDHRVYRIGGKS